VTWPGWCSQNLTFAREAVALAGDAVTTETIGGQAYLVARRPARAAAGTPVRLLPGFDEYVLGYKDRSAILTAEEELRVVPGKNGMFLGTVVVGGLVVGTWNRKTSARRTVVTVTPFGTLSATRRREIERAATAYGRHLGKSRRGHVSGAGRAGPLTQYGGGHRKGEGGHRLLSCS
jgi:hypothetical protein